LLGLVASLVSLSWSLLINFKDLFTIGPFLFGHSIYQAWFFIVKLYQRQNNQLPVESIDTLHTAFRYVKIPN